MPQTTQCNHCGIILNLPPGIKPGKRLKCPRCATRFVISESDASSASTAPGMDDAAITTMFEIPKNVSRAGRTADRPWAKAICAKRLIFPW